MSKPQEPKKPKQPRSKKLKVSKKDQWTNILKEIHANNAPIECLESVQVSLADGTTVVVDIRQLIDEGNDPDIIELMIQSKLDALDHIIEDVNYFVSADLVAKKVQPITDRILKDL